jgi:branched-chain amino acid transport system substrate-binding protein
MKKRDCGLVVLFILMLSSIFIIYTESEAKETYRIGIVNNSTGFMGIVGIPQDAGSRLATEVINREGGINGNPLETIIYDGESKPEVCLRMARKLVDRDKIDVMISGNFSPGIAVIVPVALEYKIPTLKYGTYVVDAVKEPWMFSMGTDGHFVGRGLVDYLHRKGYKTLAFIQIQDAFGEAWLKGMRIALGKYSDMKELGIEKFMPGDTDITPQISKLMALKPDVIATCTAGTATIMAARTAYKLGFKGKVSSNHADTNLGFARAVEDLPTGYLLIPQRKGGVPILVEAMPDGPVKDYNLKIFKEWKAKVGSLENVEMGAQGYEFVDIIARAFKEVGKDKTKIKQWLETKRILTTSGYLQMSPTDHLGSDPATWIGVVTTQGGKFVLPK